PRGGIVPDEDRGGDPEEERAADGRIPAAGERIARAPTPADGARQGTRRHGTDPDHGRAGAGGPRGPLGRRGPPSEGGGRDAPRGPQRGRIPDRPGRGDRESEGRGTPERSVPASVPRDDERRVAGEPLEPVRDEHHEQGELARRARHPDRERARRSPG